MLFEAYAKLVRDFPNDCDQLFGQALTVDKSVWLSVDGDAYPSLLFATRQDAVRNDIELRSVSVHFSRNCIIEAADSQATSGIYTVVRLYENDPDITRMMLRLLEEAFQARTTRYTNKEIATRVLELAELFKQIGESTGDIVGLWGELYVLLRASNLNTAVKCWCLSRNAKYDYVSEGFALEAKTTLRPRRKHRFSLDQLRPSGKFQVYVASLAVVELNSGRTGAELMDEMCGKIDDDDLRARFLAQCLVKGGRDIYRNTLKLGVLPDGKSLMILDASTIPVPEIAQGSPIENVRFDVDLTDLSPVSRREMQMALDLGGRI